MSNNVFPSLPGITPEIIKTPIFSTGIQRSTSGNREVRVAYMQAPIYKFSIPIEFLRDKFTTQSPSSPYNELKSLMGFYQARLGAFDSFLFTDQTDYNVTTQRFGIGDNTTRTFQLCRTYGGVFTENVENVNGSIQVYIDGFLTTAYTIGSTGIVTFTSAPSLGEILTWTGSFYYRCRFESDEQEFMQMMQDMWSVSKLDMRGSPANKV